MSRAAKAYLTALALLLGAADARAQVCGKDFYGPCLPDTKPAKKPSIDPMERTPFDEAGFAGDDKLIKSFLFSDATGGGSASLTAASAPEPTHDAPAAHLKAAPKPKLKSSDDEGTTPLDPEVSQPGRTIDPVRTLVRRDPEAGAMVKVVAPTSATGRLDWLSKETERAPRYAMVEETFNHQSGMWEGAPKRAARTDLLEDAARRNYIRPTAEAE